MRLAPRAGNSFVGVDLTLVNRTTTPVQAEGLGFWVRDSQGNAYPPVAVAEDQTAFPVSGGLAPERASRGWLVFEVPTDAARLRLEFDPSKLRLAVMPVLIAISLE
jgi:hypothetical protein